MPGRGVTRPSRISRARILEQLRVAARKGDRTALALALDEMKTLAMSPRYWERYLDLLSHPLARLADLLVIKQGERIARQKGHAPRRERPAAPARGAGKKKAARPARRRPGLSAEQQPLLFPDLER